MPISPVLEIEIRTPDGQRRLVPLERDSYTLGRSSLADLCYPEDSGLSRSHLRIERTPNGWRIADLNSKNGTLLNGEKLTDPQPLRLGDRINCGHLQIDFGRPHSTELKTVVFVADENTDSSISAATIFARMPESADELLKGGDTKNQMEALLRAGRELAGHRPLAELFEVILNLAIDAVGARRGVLMTLEGEELILRAARGEEFRISKVVREKVIGERQSMLVRDAQLDEALREQMSIVEQRVRSVMAVPLQTSERVIGLIYLDSPGQVLEFSPDDLNLLSVMANVAAIRIEHARLAEVEAAEQAMQRELEQAAEIQRRLLPASAPVIPGWDLAGYNAACRTVGGDYYDFFAYGEDGKFALVVGDVAGKGMPAAMLMSSLQARVQVLSELGPPVAQFVARLNKTISANCPMNRFITFFAGVLDPATGELSYCNAGHNPPLLVRANGDVEMLEGGGMILGILGMARYEQFTAQLNPGDVLVAFSDGVTEAPAPNVDEEFGEIRLADTIKAGAHEHAIGLIEGINRVLIEWTHGGVTHDDVTLVVVKRGQS